LVNFGPQKELEELLRVDYEELAVGFENWVTDN